MKIQELTFENFDAEVENRVSMGIAFLSKGIIVRSR